LQLDLSFNRSETISSSLFASLNQLEELNLESNRLKHICFQLSASTLTKLNLKFNLIDKYYEKTDSFGIFDQLESFDISFNRLSDIDFHPFFKSGNTVIKILKLNNNQIETIDSSTFEVMIYLLELDLAANRIENIDDQAFKNLKILQWLDLSQNNLTL
jgi:Leucine-rich repeat (LRR) protein